MAITNRPPTSEEIAEQLKRPESFYKQSLASAVATVEKTIKDAEELIRTAFKNSKLEEFLLTERRKEEDEPKQAITFKPLDPVMAATLGPEGKQYQELVDDMNKLRDLQGRLNSLMKSNPEAFRHLKTANENRAARNTKLLSEIIDSSFPDLDDNRKDIILSEFNKFEQSATTVVMREARYLHSVKQWEASKGQNTPNAAISSEIVEQRSAKDKATQDVLFQEFKMRFLLRDLFLEANPEKTEAQAMEDARRVLKARMHSENIQQRIKDALETFNGEEISEAVTEMNEKGVEASKIAKATLAQGLLRETAQVESAIKQKVMRLSPTPAGKAADKDEELEQRQETRQSVKR